MWLSAFPVELRTGPRIMSWAYRGLWRGGLLSVVVSFQRCFFSIPATSCIDVYVLARRPSFSIASLKIYMYVSQAEESDCRGAH